MSKENAIRVLLVEPEKTPSLIEIPNTIESICATLDCNICQAIYPFEELVALLCDEESKLTQKAMNRVLRDDEGEIYDIVRGKFIICGLGNTDFISLTDELVEKMTRRFRTPELFIPDSNGKITVFTKL